MDELRKIRRVIAEADPRGAARDAARDRRDHRAERAAPGELFQEAVDVTGIVLTKLDGTAKGGIALAIAEESGMPVKLIGIGEALEDLRPFDPETSPARYSSRDRARRAPTRAPARTTCRATRRTLFTYGDGLDLALRAASRLRGRRPAGSGWVRWPPSCWLEQDSAIPRRPLRRSQRPASLLRVRVHAAARRGDGRAADTTVDGARWRGRSPARVA